MRGYQPRCGMIERVGFGLQSVGVLKGSEGTYMIICPLGRDRERSGNI
jgi:hypothetical protein